LVQIFEKDDEIFALVEYSEGDILEDLIKENKLSLAAIR